MENVNKYSQKKKKKLQAMNNTEIDAHQSIVYTYILRSQSQH